MVPMMAAFLVHAHPGMRAHSHRYTCTPLAPVHLCTRSHTHMRTSLSKLIKITPVITLEQADVARE